MYYVGMKSILSSTILFLLAVSAQALTLVWDANDPAEQITGYNVYERLSTGDKLLTPTPVASTTYPLEGVVPGAKSFYVTAVNLWGESAPSDVLQLPKGATKPGKPKAVK